MSNLTTSEDSQPIISYKLISHPKTLGPIISYKHLILGLAFNPKPLGAKISEL